ILAGAVRDSGHERQARAALGSRANKRRRETNSYGGSNIAHRIQVHRRRGVVWREGSWTPPAVGGRDNRQREARLKRENRRMTTEEKLERLTDRVDAIAQSVELLTALHRDLEKETASRFAETLQFINRLAHVAEAHEQRIDGLEGK